MSSMGGLDLARLLDRHDPRVDLLLQPADDVRQKARPQVVFALWRSALQYAAFVQRYPFVTLWSEYSREGEIVNLPGDGQRVVLEFVIQQGRPGPPLAWLPVAFTSTPRARADVCRGATAERRVRGRVNRSAGPCDGLTGGPTRPQQGALRRRRAGRHTACVCPLCRARAPRGSQCAAPCG
jgi:hypothetical protein